MRVEGHHYDFDLFYPGAPDDTLDYLPVPDVDAVEGAYREG